MNWATAVLQWQAQDDAMVRAGAYRQSLSQFGLDSETRVHEAGIASNRGSECRGEFVTELCTHRPSHPGRWWLSKVGHVRIPLVREGPSMSCRVGQC